MLSQEKTQALKQLISESPAFKKYYGTKIETIIKVLPMFNAELVDKMYAFLKLESKSK
jgi:hypothetical protein